MNVYSYGAFVLAAGVVLGLLAVLVDKSASGRTLQNVINSCEKHEMYLDKGVAIQCMVRKTTAL